MSRTVYTSNFLLRIQNKNVMQFFFIMILFCVSLISCTDKNEQYPQDIGKKNKPETVNKMLGKWQSESFHSHITFYCEFYKDMTVKIYTQSPGADWALGIKDRYNWMTRDNNRIYWDFFAQDGWEDEPGSKIWPEGILIEDGVMSMEMFIGTESPLKFTKIKDN